MTAKSAGRIERWTYIGRRVDRGDVLYAWLDSDRRIWMFPSGRSLAIGARYDVAVVRADDGPLRIGPAPSFVGDPVADSSALAKWTAHDRVADGLLRLQRSEQRARRAASARYASVTLQQLRDLHTDLPRPAQAVLLTQVFLFLTDV